MGLVARTLVLTAALASSIVVAGCSEASTSSDPVLDTEESTAAAIDYQTSNKVFVNRVCGRVQALSPAARCSSVAPYRQIAVNFDIGDPLPGAGAPPPAAMTFDVDALAKVYEAAAARGLDVPVRKLLPSAPPGGGGVDPRLSFHLETRAVSGVVTSLLPWAVGVLTEQGVKITAEGLVDPNGLADANYRLDPASSTLDVQRSARELDQSIAQLDTIATAWAVADNVAKGSIFLMTLSCPATILVSAVLAVSWSLPSEAFKLQLETSKKILEKQRDAHRAELARRGATSSNPEPRPGGEGADPGVIIYVKCVRSTVCVREGTTKSCETKVACYKV